MKYVFLLIFSLFISDITAQEISFLKHFNFAEYGHPESIVQQGNNYLLLAYEYSPPNYHGHQHIIYKIDGATGSCQDSTYLSDIIGYEQRRCCLMKKNNDSILISGSYEKNSMYYIYTGMVQSSNLSFTPIVIDSLPYETVVHTYLINSIGNLVIMTINPDTSGFLVNYGLYELDSSFTVVKHVITTHKDGYLAGIAETKNDSCYLLSSTNWTVKVNYDFEITDTLLEDVISYVGYLKQYNPNTFFSNWFLYVNGDPPQDLGDRFIGLFKYTSNGVCIDTFVYGMPEKDQDNSQVGFLDFKTNDTLFSCGIAGYIDPDMAYDNWMDIVKMDSSGNIIWQKFLGYDANYLFCTIAATDDGGCIVAYAYWDWRTQMNKKTDIIVVKLDKYGNSPVGISEPVFRKNGRVSVYPNPALVDLNILIKGVTNAEIILSDLTGRVCHRQHLSGQCNRLDISSFSSGIYFYSVFSGQTVIGQGKFVKGQGSAQ